MPANKQTDSSDNDADSISSNIALQEHAEHKFTIGLLHYRRRGRTNQLITTNDDYDNEEENDFENRTMQRF